jgi:hypothetical protein
VDNPGIEPGALMARTFSLPRGPKVRLRLARPRDEAGLRALIERSGGDPSEFDVASLTWFDPRARVVICATDSREALLGIAAVALGDGPRDPDVLLVDETLTDGLEELLRGVLAAEARAFSRALAA